MDKLEKKFRVKVVKYNLGEPFMSFNKDFENKPSESDILQTLIDCDEKSPNHKYYGTIIHVEEFYNVRSE